MLQIDSVYFHKASVAFAFSHQSAEPDKAYKWAKHDIWLILNLVGREEKYPDLILPRHKLP